MKKMICAVLAMGLISSSVLAGNFAATVADSSGKVMVNKGEGFIPLAVGTGLNAGDKVLVGQDSFAVLSYENCAVSVSNPTVVTVSAEAACKDGEVIQPVADLDPVAAGLPLPLLFLGAAAVGGGVLLVSGVLDSDDNDDVPVSVD